VGGDGDVGAANVRACQTGIGVLNGARGGTTIPAGDRRGVYNHLAAHLRDADVEPADLRASGAAIERRTVAAQELRAVEEEGQAPRIEGYAALCNVLSDGRWGVREQITPGAFTKAIAEDDVRALWNHDSSLVLGRIQNGTLKLHEDERGLAFEVTPPDTQWARDALVTLRRGDVNQMSFGFETVRDEWHSQEDGGVIRTLQEVRVYDVSPVAFPAYPQTTAEVRSRAVELKLAASSQEDGAGNTEDPGVQVHTGLLRYRLDLAEREV